eukprot:6291897-Prymnesium_polylepis.1
MKSSPEMVSPVELATSARTSTPRRGEPDESFTWTSMRKGVPTRTVRGGAVKRVIDVGVSSIDTTGNVALSEG